MTHYIGGDSAMYYLWPSSSMPGGYYQNTETAGKINVHLPPGLTDIKGGRQQLLHGKLQFL